MDRRELLQTAGVAGAAATLPLSLTQNVSQAAVRSGGQVSGLVSGARALVETLQAEGTLCVFGIPGAQGNELWDQMKQRQLPYLLVTNEFSASIMADGAARATGRPGVLCVVPGPGITNALTGLGEARMDSVPLVCLAIDVARGPKYRPYQVHELPNATLLKPVCKAVFEVAHVKQIPEAVRQAFRLADEGEPGPVAVVIPYPLLIETALVHSAPLGPRPVAFDAHAFDRVLAILRDKRLRVGIYAGQGCMDFSTSLVRVAQMLQAPVATSVSGKGVISECHPLSVGWGYGPHATRTAELAFEKVDVVLAIGVKYCEVSTGYYSNPTKRIHIHVDSCAEVLGKVVSPSLCVHADAGVFLAKLLEQETELARPVCKPLVEAIARHKAAEFKEFARCYASHGIDPMHFVLALRRATREDALLFVDVTVVEHLAAMAYTVFQPRTYFNPVDNQAMGWSIPAAIGAQRVLPGRQIVTLTGDGCLLMSGLELSTAAREGLPVKFFILDDSVYTYMQILQKNAYKRTTATMLARLDYPSLAKALGLTHVELTPGDLEAKVRGILAIAGPVLITVPVDLGKRPIRWIEAVKSRYTRELTAGQKTRFLTRLGVRSVQLRPQND
jgi:acetolactate synthase-1/2/3 large subunit